MAISIDQMIRKAKNASKILDRINESLRVEFRLLEDEFAEALSSDTQLTHEVGEYLREARSKRLRAAMHMFAARACGYEGRNHIKIAAAVELIHLATLLHDDVIDNADTRRGRPSINARWNNRVAILMGDFLYCRGFRLALNALERDGIDQIATATAMMCEGEMFQIQKENDLLTSQDYFQVIKGKTANLFSCAMKLGGMLANSEQQIIDDLGQFGLYFGMAFQITDDTLDYIAIDSDWGKNVGTDIACGKQTLPLIRTLEVADAADRHRLANILKPGPDNHIEVDAAEIIEIVKRYDGIEYSTNIAIDFAEKAGLALQKLPQSESRDLLGNLADYVSKRSF